MALGPEFHADMSLHEFYTIKYRNRLEDLSRGAHEDIDFIRKVGKLTIPSFDGSTKVSSRAWVHKLDTYLQFNWMFESEAITFATLHLEGEAHEWWYRGLVTLGHNQITYYKGSQRILWITLIKRIHRFSSEIRQVATDKVSQSIHYILS
jgi:hypothetical protein